MATRMQQRRGTAAQWISTNAGAGPVLNAGEMGWESDTNKFKIGDGVNNWSSLDYFADINSTVNPAFGTSITFEGATADSYETTLQVTDPTADRTITLPNVDGTVITTGNLSDITNIGVFSSTITMEGSTANDFELTLSAGDPTADRTLTFPDATDTLVGRATTDTLTNKSISLGSNTVTSTLAQLNTAVTDADVASLAGTETLTNKTLTSPTVSGLTLSDSSIVIEGTTANAFETTLTVTDPTANRTITFPDATGEVALVENLTTSLTGAYVLAGDVGAIDGVAELDGSKNVITALSVVFEGATADAHETFLTVTEPASDITISLPSTADTLVGRATTDTLTNKTIDIASNTLTGVAALSGATFTGAVSGTDLTLSGNLTVNGTTTNINSTSLVVEDKNVVLGDTATPTDTTADGGGITLKGTSDKTFNWVDATDAWTSSEHLNLASGKSLYLNGTLLKDATETLTNKTLTSPTLTGTVTLPQGKLTGGSTTVSADTATTVSTVALADFTTMEYTVSIKQGSKIRSSKVLVHTDGTTVDSVEHSILETGGAMTGVNVTAAVSSTNCILTVTITNASSTNAAVKVINTII